MACISCGVITSAWLWRISSFCVSAMAFGVRKLVRFLLICFADRLYTRGRRDP